jgi:VanZ family protein
LTDPPTPLPPRRPFRAWLCWATTLAWAALVFNLSTATYGGAFSGWLLQEILAFLHVALAPGTFLAVHFFFRKLAHLTEYAILSSLLYVSLQKGGPLAWRARTALGCVLIAGVYSVTDEFHQLFVPGRTASLIDCGIDTVGASLGMLVVYANDRLFHARSKNPAAANASTAER